MRIRIVRCERPTRRHDRNTNLQISFEPGLGAYQSLAQKMRVPFSKIFSFSLQFWGFEGDFKARAKPRCAPNSGCPKGPKIGKKNSYVAWNFQSRLNISISTFRIPHKNRALLCGSLEIFNLAWKFQSRRVILNLFNLWALRVKHFPKPCETKARFLSPTHISLLVVRNWSWKWLNEGNFMPRFVWQWNVAVRVRKEQYCSTPDFSEGDIAVTKFYDSGGSLGEELGKMFCAFSCFICCAEWATNLLPKFLPIYHSMSCGWKFKISSPRASGVLGPPQFWKTHGIAAQRSFCDAESQAKHERRSLPLKVQAQNLAYCKVLGSKCGKTTAWHILKSVTHFFLHNLLFEAEFFFNNARAWVLFSDISK